MDKSIPNSNTLKRNIEIVILLLFVLSLIPLLLISKYDHSSADDYTYGFLTAQTWMRTHSFIETLNSACQQVGVTYLGWQGTFSAIFLMALQPAAFGESVYMWTPIILVFSFIIGTFLFLKVFLIDYMKADKYNFVIISFVILILSIQFNGNAKTYDTEVNQRILAYRDASRKTVQVKDYSVKPLVLYENDIVEDKSIGS